MIAKLILILAYCNFVKSTYTYEFCPDGFTGFCLNGGSCLIVNGQNIVCQCLEPYGGY